MRSQDAVIAYELPQIDLEIPAEWQLSPVCGSQRAAGCPLCRQPVRATGGGSPAAASATRAKPAPAKPVRERICPECERVLFAELL